MELLFSGFDFEVENAFNYIDRYDKGYLTISDFDEF
jgi:hypothetical protein